MAKGVYFGIAEKARKVKKLYFGVGDKSRKVKKMYFGVDGKARICYSSGINKIDTPLNITESVGGRFSWRDGSCAPVGDKLVVSMSKATGQMDTFSTSLVKGSAPLPLIGVTNQYGWCAAKLPSYAVFAGGKHTTDRDGRDYTIGQNGVYSYNASLAVTSASYLTRGRYYIGAGSIGDYVTFAGGTYDNSSSDYDYIETFNNSLSRGVSIQLNGRMSNPIGLNVPGYLIYAHGYNYNIPSINSQIHILDTSLNKIYRTISRSSNISTGSSSGASNGAYALYMGGQNVPVDVVSASLVVSELPIGTDGRFNACGISFDEQAVFAGGSMLGGIDTKDAVTFNKNLVRDVIQDLSVGRRRMFSGRLNNLGFFIGGDSPFSNVVEVYEQ
ncbi:hypothetical protein KQI61_06660 [Anaerocolumna aminovalerica]|uniref:hypothetical protein n=1 Tax=Anaerocolumna aminovalerica TaxID=1527 RepID=UPI001C0EE14D|nr:hypothetical protein [Anaerocolumna aminovalerica]MBU5331874.1 hypothetical protein [Anaerocolumna aminovalerica]